MDWPENNIDKMDLDIVARAIETWAIRVAYKWISFN